MSAHNINSTLQDCGGEKPLFQARLMPYRSLGLSGFKILMGLVGLFCFCIGVGFLMLGLWPVLGFMGLDVLLVYWAFKASYRSARAYEDVAVSRQSVVLCKVSPSGKSTNYAFPQFGTRFEVDRHDEIGITKMRLANRARAVEFGYFLNPADRESFARAFSGALAMARK